MIARFLGVKVWELSRVATHYQEEARVILQAQYETKVAKKNQLIKLGIPVAAIIVPEF
jgi:hypothetical protein